jgi:hypothetical protein
METGNPVLSSCKRLAYMNRDFRNLTCNSLSQGYEGPYPHALEVHPRIMACRENYSLLAKAFGLPEYFIRVLNEGDSMFLQGNIRMKGGEDGNCGMR